MGLLQKLMQRGVIDDRQARDIETEARLRGMDVSAVLETKGITKEEIAKARQEDLGVPDVPTISVDPETIPYEILDNIPQESASHYKMVPLGIEEGVLQVGMTDPQNVEALDALNFIVRQSGLPFKVYLISESDFQQVLAKYQSLGGEVSQALNELETELTADEKSIQDAINEQESTGNTYIKEDAPVIKIVATILRYAVDGNASDVHIEKTETEVKIRFRVDGILHTSLKLPGKIHRAIVARIKVLASMRLDERRKPQDGRFSATIGGHKIDFRVSTFPTYHGEKIVMRILDRDRGFRPITDLDFGERNLAMVRAALTKPHGLILVTGPTGSGKSTTLYSMLAEIDRDTKNVLSLEDPVEYHMEGVNQSQVHPEIGYTFANGLRTTLRQDPDVIMVGEIRDGETARLAVQAALTGHLVLSTLHTNSAIGAIPRLVDMGVDPYLIAPTLVLTIGQRLVRRACPDAAVQVPMNESIRMMIESEFHDLPAQYRTPIPNTITEVHPTPECPTGMRGRMAVFELLPMTPEIEHIILTDPTEENIYKIARQNGMITMKEDAIIKSFAGNTPFAEVGKLGGMLLSEAVEIGE